MMIYKLALLSGVLSLLMPVGCATHSRYRCDDAHSEAGSANVFSKTVYIGGNVYRPGSIQIGPDGIRLHNAIEMVGGVRREEQPPASSAPRTASAFKAFTDSARLTGELTARLDLFQLEDRLAGAALLGAPGDAEETDTAIAKVKAKLDEQIKATEKRTEELVEELAKSYSKDALLLQMDVSYDVGYNQEQVKILDNEAVARRLNWDRRVLESDLLFNLDQEERYLETVQGADSVRHAPVVQGPAGVAFVRVDRASSRPPLSLFIPYELVISGIAGEVALRDGDVVSVVDLRETSLAVLDSGPTTVSDVLVQGLIETPGVLEAVPTIGSMAARTDVARDAPRGAWVLARPDAMGRSLQLFVLSGQLVGPNGAAAGARTLPGDVYTYTLLPMVPLIFDSQVERVLDDEKQRCLDRVREKREQHRQHRHQGVDQFHDRLHNCFQHIPGL